MHDGRGFGGNGRLGRRRFDVRGRGLDGQRFGFGFGGRFGFGAGKVGFDGERFWFEFDGGRFEFDRRRFGCNRERFWRTKRRFDDGRLGLGCKRGGEGWGSFGSAGGRGDGLDEGFAESLREGRFQYRSWCKANWYRMERHTYRLEASCDERSPAAKSI